MREILQPERIEMLWKMVQWVSPVADFGAIGLVSLACGHDDLLGVQASEKNGETYAQLAAPGHPPRSDQG